MNTNDPLPRPGPTRPTLRIVRDLRAPSDAAHQITGGKGTPKLLEAAVKGKVFKSVEIHGTA